jgi:hypothetical protein
MFVLFCACDVMRMCSLLKKMKIYNKKRKKGGLDHGENPAEKRII